jgi:hypothetical protein
MTQYIDKSETKEVGIEKEIINWWNGFKAGYELGYELGLKAKRE